jgi:hypothetical protein
MHVKSHRYPFKGNVPCYRAYQDTCSCHGVTMSLQLSDLIPQRDESCDFTSQVAVKGTCSLTTNHQDRRVFCSRQALVVASQSSPISRTWPLGVSIALHSPSFPSSRENRLISLCHSASRDADEVERIFLVCAGFVLRDRFRGAGWRSSLIV